ncbi:DUF4430 domain-containing protein [Paenibacillus sp. GCM10023248]|uniref:DUF4430 domain-containing protein n=1 Tax=unclassified Paenibacillus TaxID=185978 RepID=UPI0023798F15|nr:DUF4430 domain-containing protein [Paenibacillus sp. MAHUQ-63]MDD9271194.1 DUF4430 domain-containing protein [Paenibacillus sp. MAHUQ-63]
MRFQHRLRFKSLTAFMMSLVLLFSLIGSLLVPGQQAVAAAGTGPSSIREWLPAPGQFVNEAGWGGAGDINSKWTNTPGAAGVSLGSFGGGIVFQFNEPIQNNPKNPYGVDFTVFGNAFPGNEEPAGVAVAQDDGTGNPGPWYFIAGSEHYEDSTIWDYRVTYTNPEPDFTSPNGVNVPWTDNHSGSGEVKTNGSHLHAYYPIPANYKDAPADFNNQSYTYSGVKIAVRSNAFGYPDSHGNGSAPYNEPANPYVTSPTKGDPIDISWAVDSAGQPVSLANVSFVKVYNAVQMDGGVVGEIGSEVTSIEKVTPNDTVGETADLSSIVLTGTGADAAVSKTVTVTSGVYSYANIRINADTVKLTANGAATTVFVNNTSGTTGVPVDKEITLSETTPKIVRVIAQNGINTPKIYYLSIQKGTDVVAPQPVPVSVVISGYSATAGKSVVLNGATTVEEGQTAAQAITKVLNQNDIAFVNPSGNYITSIGGLASFDGGPKSGWMYLINGQFAMVGIADLVLHSNDVITLVYSDDYEQDVTLLANKTQLNAAIAEAEALQSGSYTEASWQALQASLTLAKAVAASSGAIQYHADTALEKLTAARQGLVPKSGQLQDAIAGAISYSTSPVGGVSSVWSAIGIARAGEKLPGTYLQKLISNVTDDNANFDRVTELEKTILGITAAGGDATNVAGYNLIDKLANSELMTKQGINGLQFALLALDSKLYQVSSDALWTRDKIIHEIVSRQNADGGFVLSSGASDPDVTAMTLTALAPYHNHPAVVTADTIAKAGSWLSTHQGTDGGYTVVYSGSWGSSESNSSESVSQAIIALTANGMDPTSSAYTKNGITLLDKLFSFRQTDDGFSHMQGSGSDGMATEQALQALVAYKIYKSGSGERLYDLTKLSHAAPVEVPLPSGDTPKIEIPLDEQDYLIPIAETDANKEVTIEIPNNSSSTISVSLPSGIGLPQITALKGNVSMIIPKGTQTTSGDASALELITSQDAADAALKGKVSTLVPAGRKLDSVDQAVTFGGGSSRVQFNQFVTLTFTGMKGKEAAYIENGVPHAIRKYDNDAAGLASGNMEYAYDSGNALIIKTKHFTDFIAYASSTTSSGGGTNPAPKPTVTLSVDKLTLNKGYVIPSLSVELQSGDTAWSILKRTLDTKGINYRFKWYDTYGSAYLQSIDGDGEFDHGSGSGWMYSVNGSYPGNGASSYVLKNGDSVQWRYTTNLGKDLGQPTVTTPGGIGGGGAILSDKKSVFDVPATITQDYKLNITKELKDKEQITVNIPNVKPKVILNVTDVQDSIPSITVVKGEISLSIDKGTALKSGDPNIEVLTTLDTGDSNLQRLVLGGLADDIKQAAKLKHAFAMGNGNQSVIFDKPLTFVIKGAKAQRAGFIEGNAFTPIEVYETEEKAVEATKGQDKVAYAFVKDTDLIIKTNHFTDFVTFTTAAETEQAFDLTKLYSDAALISTWAIDAVSEASQKAFVEGGYGTFNPQATVTRAEFTKMLANVLGLDVKTSKQTSFQDVSQDDWFYPYVNAAYQAGFISGYDNDHFYPNEKLTREQMAVIMVKALSLPAAGQMTELEDMNQVSDWAKSGVQSVVASGLMTGWNNRFQPSEEVTREMAIVVAMRAYQKK